ncbi:MAG: hypothetical protein ACUVQ2_06225 [Dissulfurimicrobium sp.]|uniref:hypothetical protein n=1 Tax=Dissulfurimicrobium sp. TaxID=2022436 RepID=UPI004048EAC5
MGQHNLKRLLAYHSIENIGIILIGIGLDMIGGVARQPGHGLSGFYRRSHVYIKPRHFQGPVVHGRRKHIAWRWHACNR